MTVSLTRAEELALTAQDLAAFQDFNLLGLRSKVHDVLKLVGRDGIFASYTMHDSSHLNAMLEMLDWLVPDGTKDIMTPADWLLVVLGTYFHDMGMLVTEQEFAARDSSGFHEFCEAVLFAGDEGKDYRKRVESLGERKDRYLYEEFVRTHHAERISDWIRGRTNAHLGYSASAVAQVSELVGALPRSFVDDLAMVCDSHHLADLGDATKYTLDQPYGNSDLETANTQYAAILLRTADLLHITADRTPSVLLRTIDPKDPVSQVEWAKQGAVRRVRSQKAKNREGVVTDDAPRSTIEVIAEFENPDGFFGLTSYLHYAARELKLSHDWVAASQLDRGTPHSFPWRYLDDSRVTASGFLPERLSFTLDQERILRLLTGHTLYNDTSVVVRELVQNAIDAVRLQAFIDEVDSESGTVEVEWDSEGRQLIVRDLGTGMTQQVIENNLLKAGASRYQDDQFQKKYAGFSPISRFGIGVLSAFMVADSVEIRTVAEEEEEARILTLRSVNGRYLVQLLDKHADRRIRQLLPHGTEIRLTVRESARMANVVETLRKWIMFPRCRVVVRVDGGDAQSIGFVDPAHAVRHALATEGFELQQDDEPQDGAVRVVQIAEESVTTAFAVVWRRYFREWGFMPADRLTDNAGSEAERVAFGTCVEGIRVEEPSAGFRDDAIVAIANASGLKAPKTNVARSDLEATAERTAMLRAVYGAYLGHVAEEVEQLATTRRMSLTWAAQEAQYLLGPILRQNRRLNSPEGWTRPVETSEFIRALRGTRVIPVEQNGRRELTTPDELSSKDILWTVDSAFVAAAERLLREVPGAGSLASVAHGFESESFDLPVGVTLVGYQGRSPLYGTVLQGREVNRFVVIPEQRRADLAWKKVEDEGSWIPVGARTTSDSGVYRVSAGGVFVSTREIEIDSPVNYVAIRAHDELRLIGETPIAAFLREVLAPLLDDRSAAPVRDYLAVCVTAYLVRTRPPVDMTDFVEGFAAGERSSRRMLLAIQDVVDLQALADALHETPQRIFNTAAWSRRDTDVWGA